MSYEHGRKFLLSEGDLDRILRKHLAEDPMVKNNKMEVDFIEFSRNRDGEVQAVVHIEPSLENLQGTGEVADDLEELGDIIEENEVMMSLDEELEDD